jgi:UPF0176 protein
LSFLNAAFYCFAPLRDLPRLRHDWRNRLDALGVRGTIIFAPEGANGFLAGAPDSVRTALTDLRTLPGFSGLTAKESYSKEVPFGKLSVKLKKEIVTFRQDLPPAPTRRIAPGTLARWLDEGRDVVLLDTRNVYEVRLGTFAGAHAFAIDHFVEFAGLALPEEWKHKPVVTFCTGGIRCEKAAPYLASRGFTDVYQLEDGILGYFEKVGGRHWNGECFVFDQRIALGPDLAPTGARLCAHCQGPVPRARQECIHCGKPCP